MKTFFSCSESVNLSIDLLITLIFLAPIIGCQGREKESKNTVWALA